MPVFVVPPPMAKMPALTSVLPVYVLLPVSVKVPAPFLARPPPVAEVLIVAVAAVVDQGLKVIAGAAV